MRTAFVGWSIVDTRAEGSLDFTTNIRGQYVGKLCLVSIKFREGHATFRGCHKLNYHFKTPHCLGIVGMESRLVCCPFLSRIAQDAQIPVRSLHVGRNRIFSGQGTTSSRLC